MGSIGGVSLLLIVLMALLLFGPNKLPELGKAFGKTLREFKQATNGLVEEEDNKEKKDSNK